MRFQFFARTGLVAMLGLASAGPMAQPAERACVLEGTFQIAGQRVVVNDCAENRAMPKDDFREVCKGMSEFTLAGQTYKAKVTYVAACPAGAQGTCEGMFGGALNASYYKRDARTLEDTRKSCVAQQGRWK